MVRKATAFVFAFSILSLSYAETTYTFLVLRERLDPSIYRTAGKRDREQPLWDTIVLNAPNTTYALVQITPRNVVERNDVLLQEALGNSIMVIEDSLDTIVERGELITVRTANRRSRLPRDFYTDYSVRVSS